MARRRDALRNEPAPLPATAIRGWNREKFWSYLSAAWLVDLARQGAARALTETAVFQYGAVPCRTKRGPRTPQPEARLTWYTPEICPSLLMRAVSSFRSLTSRST